MANVVILSQPHVHYIDLQHHSFRPGRFVGEGGVRSAWVTGRYTLRDWVMSDPFLFKSHLLGKVAQSARFVKGTSR